MRIEAAVRKVLKEQNRAGDFGAQLTSNREFKNRMENAGVVTRKQAFSIPLMERIVHSTR